MNKKIVLTVVLLLILTISFSGYFSEDAHIVTIIK